MRNRRIVYQHVQGVLVLEAGDHCCNERVPCDSSKNIALVADMFHLLQANDWKICQTPLLVRDRAASRTVSFAQYLQSKDLLCILLLRSDQGREPNSCKCACKTTGSQQM